MVFFVCFEGLDCSGKSTQIDRLSKRVESIGREPLVVRSPGGTPVGEKIREIVLGDEPIGDMTEMFLHVACRAEMWEAVIRENLADGGDRVVIMSRWFDSLMAYQGRGRGFDILTLYGLKSIILDSWNPDLTVLLDIPVEDSMARMAFRGGPSDKMEREDARFYGAVRRQFLDLARSNKDRYVVIDGMLDPDEVERRVWNAVEEKMASIGNMMRAGKSYDHRSSKERQAMGD